MSLSTKILLLTLVILYISVREPCSYIENGISIFAIIFLAFLSSPRNVIMDSRGIRCVLGWKENWDNIESFRLEKTSLIFNTKFRKTRKITNINKEDFSVMINFINRRLSDDRIKGDNIEQ